MFPSGVAASGLSFAKVVGGISKTLGIVNQAIPIYKEVKPVVGKARDMYSIVKEFRKAPSTNKQTINPNNQTKTFNQNIIDARYTENVNANKKNTQLNLSPVFFQ